MRNFSERLTVCSWSLRPKNPEELLTEIRQIGIPRIQLALDPLRLEPKIRSALPKMLSEAGVKIVSGMFGTLGEDYSTMETIRRTGGVLPDETWNDNLANIQATANLAQNLELKLVTFHAGFVPHDQSDPGYEKMLHRLRLIADIFAAKKIELALETGQETAPALKEFLHKLGRANVGVNFDPANMILYDKGNPIDALKILGPFLQQCHIKDARKTKTPGTWGEEVAVGQGEVDWREFFAALEKLNFEGYCCIEREAGEQRVEDICAAKKFVEQLEN